jgi:hypothetical protein
MNEYELYAMMMSQDPDTSRVSAQDILGSIWDRLAGGPEAERRRQIEDELAGLAELKRVNSMHPTEKRTKAILELERRYRAAGILK